VGSDKRGEKLEEAQVKLKSMQSQRALITALCLTALIVVACHSAQRGETHQTGEALVLATSPVAAGASAQPVSRTAAQQAQATAAPKKTDLTYADRAAWRKSLNWPDDCEQAFEATTSKDMAGLKFYKLAPRQHLVEVMCARGAYQGEQRFLFYDETGPSPTARLLSFKTYEAPDEKYESLKPQETVEIWGLAKFNAQAKELTILNKFRGAGDCGAYSRYGFEKGTPQLKEFRAQLACNGRGGRDPRKWRKIN
jgi:hypothetical protein